MADIIPISQWQALLAVVDLGGDRERHALPAVAGDGGAGPVGGQLQLLGQACGDALGEPWSMP